MRETLSIVFFLRILEFRVESHETHETHETHEASKRARDRAQLEKKINKSTRMRVLPECHAQARIIRKQRTKSMIQNNIESFRLREFLDDYDISGEIKLSVGYRVSNGLKKLRL